LCHGNDVLDRTRVEGMMFAENRCSKFCTGDVDWTPALSRISARLDIDIELSPLRLDITTPEHIEAWRKSRERTVLGPTGVHCGHLIAGT
jgi:hypothetical protein